RHRTGNEEGQEGRVERAPDERERAELSRDRVPDLSGPEPESELLDREPGVGNELEGDRGSEQDDDRRHGAGRDAKKGIVGAGLWSAAVGSFQTRAFDHRVSRTVARAEFFSKPPSPWSRPPPEAARIPNRRSTSARRGAPTS